MAQLPLAIRRDIRDQFASDKGQLQQQVKELNETLGHPVSCNIDWPILWTQCESHFEDKSTFIPYVVSQISTLYDALSTKLEDESSPWTEQFLEQLAPAQALKVDIEASPGAKDVRGGTQARFDHARVRLSRNQGLILNIPCKPCTQASSSQLLRELDSLFAADSGPLEAEDDDWAAVSTPSSQQILTPASSFSFPLSKEPVSAKPSTLPSLSSLSRPDILFVNSTPYLIHLRYERNRPLVSGAQRLPDRIVIQSTHEPSLKLIHDYFIKWTRSDPQTREKIPLLRYTLGPSTLGPGSCYDTLIAEPFSQLSGRSGSVINPALFQCFIESVLGYDIVDRAGSSSSEGELWEFRRMTALQ